MPVVAQPPMKEAVPRITMVKKASEQQVNFMLSPFRYVWLINRRIKTLCSTQKIPTLTIIMYQLLRTWHAKSLKRSAG
jgi:hypothetical protein